MTENKECIVIVDDQEALLMIASHIIGDAFPSYTIHTAKDGLEGFEAVKTYKPKIVVTDFQMPNCDGLTLASKIRKETYQPEIIVLSGDIGACLNKAKEMKLDDLVCLAKPYSPAELQNAIKKYL
jgi:CheY-like chemotaxis protein